MKTKATQEVTFAIPIFEPLPTQYLLYLESDRWLGTESTTAIPFTHLILPERQSAQNAHTPLLDLRPLHKSVLQSALLESLYSFAYFNPIQTQFFHALFHTDQNVLVGAPTGSGKTVAAELAIFRVFRLYPEYKVYNYSSSKDLNPQLNPLNPQGLCPYAYAYVYIHACECSACTSRR